MAGTLTSWLLNCGYALLLTLLSPVILWRAVRQGRYHRGLREKLLGTTSRLTGVRASDSQNEQRAVWFHAVSVGEVVQLQKVVAAFRHQTGDAFRIVVSTSTDTGYDLAVRRFPDCQVTWFPLDFSWTVQNALQRIQPVLLVLMELEIWPNLIAACQQHGVPVAIVNARMSDRSARGYRRIRRCIAPTLRRLALVAAQSPQYAARLIALGAQAERVHVTGSIKFDGVVTHRDNPQTLALREALGIAPHELVFIAGSTQDPEERLCVDAWRQLQQQIPHVRLIVVPRHKERFDEVAAAISRQGLPLVRRSRTTETPRLSATTAKSSEVPPVILLDTIGELSACWGLADVAFVGGSFGNRGGQNMIEPAAYGAVVMFGPNTSNFRDVVSLFHAARGCLQLSEPAELLPCLKAALHELQTHQRIAAPQADSVRQSPHSQITAAADSPSALRDAADASAGGYGQRAQRVVLAQQGATDRTAALLAETVSHLLPHSSRAA